MSVTDKNPSRVLEFPEGLADTASAYFVYRLYAADGTLLYVGSTGNVLERLGSHAADKLWASQVVSVRVEAFAQRSAALAAERQAVRREKPHHNGVLYIMPDGMTPNEYRKLRDAVAREKVCEVCEEPFTATRRDAKTCSPACKQKAYRERRRKA